MTTSVDNLQNRKAQFGSGRENAEGVAREGFNDASGEYPKQEYFFGTSINKAAKGEKVNKLFGGGGDFGVSTYLADQKPSQFPYNQVAETQSGHIWEIDDTPGGERILIKHKTGSGIELRADGSVLFSSKNKKVEVTGGDQTVIVEGQGNLIYKGDLNVRVTGDYNLIVEGNMNVTAAGKVTEDFARDHVKTVGLNEDTTVKGARAKRIIGDHSETILGSNTIQVKKDQNNFVEGSIAISSHDDVIITAEDQFVVSARKNSMNSNKMSIIAEEGTLGGMGVNHFGSVYTGPPYGTGLQTCFIGSLVGCAAESLLAKYSDVSGNAIAAATASQALVLGSYIPPPPIPLIFPFFPASATAVAPAASLISSMISSGPYAIKKVSVDDGDQLLYDILKTDDYSGLFDREPTIHEIRSKLRDKANKENNRFADVLVAEGRLSGLYKFSAPPSVGRTAPRKTEIRFGTRPIGNNPAYNKSKRFTS